MATQDDDFGAQLASLSREQLASLLNELNSRSTQQFGLNRPGQPEPTLRQGAFQDPTRDVNGQQHWNSEYLKKNLFEEPSLYHQYKKYTGRKKDKKAKEEYEVAMNAESARQKQLIAERVKSVQGQMKTLDLRDKVNTQFRDLNLEGLFDRVVKQGLDSSMLGITQQHEDLARNTGFQAVGQGLGGGSVDAERIADVQSSQEQATAQAAAAAQAARAQLGQQADVTRRNLLESVSSGNPGEEARLSGEISGIQNNANAFSSQAGLTGFGMQQNQQQMAGQSQAIGGLLSNYANLYTQQNRSY